jgi:magnesium transporter
MCDAQLETHSRNKEKTDASKPVDPPIALLPTPDTTNIGADPPIVSSLTTETSVESGNLNTTPDAKQVTFHADTRASSGNSPSALRSTTTTSHVVAPHAIPQHTETSYRERLGGYLHPRDMRRLVTPFSASNEPEVIVRRHAILLNFDPLRAIILRNMLLVLVPDGADSIVSQLEQRVKGGQMEVEKSIFGGDSDRTDSSRHHAQSKDHRSLLPKFLRKDTGDSGGTPAEEPAFRDYGALDDINNNKSYKSQKTESTVDMTEWDEMNAQDWINLPFELHCVDACLHMVTSILADDTNDIQAATIGYIQSILTGSTEAGDDPLLAIRHVKNALSEMASRVDRFVSSMNCILDDDPDMTLMNLSRLITHPERFIQPVPESILEEESDEPELILESHLRAGFTLQNTLKLIQGQIDTASELIDQKQDEIRNKLLLANMLISVFSLCVASGSFIGSIYGMNVVNGQEQNPKIFDRIIAFTVTGMFLMTILIFVLLRQTGTIPKTRLYGGS